MVFENPPVRHASPEMIALHCRYIGYPKLIMKLLDDILGEKQEVTPKFEAGETPSILFSLLNGAVRIEMRSERLLPKAGNLIGFDTKLVAVTIEYKRYLETPTIEFHWSHPGSADEVPIGMRVDVLRILMEHLLVVVHRSTAIEELEG